MVSGLILLALGGALWCLVGICYEKLPKDESMHAPYLFAGGLVTCLLLYGCFMPKDAPVKDVMTVAMFLFTAGLFALPQVVFFKKAVTCGSPSGAWCIMQSAMICPLLTMSIFYNERPSLYAWCGIVLLILGIIAWGVGRKEEEGKDAGKKKNHLKFLLFALLAFLCTGIQQTLTQIPGKIPSLGENALSWRVLLMQLPWLLWGIPCIVKRKVPGKKAWFFGLVLGAAVAGGELLFFRGIDAMNMLNLSGLSYPAALNFSILLFALYCRFYLKRPFSKVELSALAFTVSGIILLMF